MRNKTDNTDKPGKTLRLYILLSLVLALPLGLTACGLLAPRPDHAFPLLPPASLNREVAGFQQIEVSYEGEMFNLQCAFTVSSTEIRLILLDPLGQRLGTLTFDGERLQQEKALGMAGKFPLPYMLEALQMIFWPPSALPRAEWRFERTEHTRTVYHRGQPVATIHYRSPSPWTGKVNYHNDVNQYSLQINTVLLDESPQREQTTKSPQRE